MKPLWMIAPIASIALTSTMARADVAPVISEAVVAAPIETVWRNCRLLVAMTTRDAIEAWMVANSSEYELAIGGSWRSSYDEASNLDDETVIHNEILAFDPGRMLAVRTVKAPADFPFPNAILDTWTVLYLETVDTGRTKVMTKMFGFDETQESREMREFFEWGNAYELEKLAEYLATAP